MLLNPGQPSLEIFLSWAWPRRRFVVFPVQSAYLSLSTIKAKLCIVVLLPSGPIRRFRLRWTECDPLMSIPPLIFNRSLALSDP